MHDSNLSMETRDSCGSAAGQEWPREDTADLEETHRLTAGLSSPAKVSLAGFVRIETQANLEMLIKEHKMRGQV